MDQWNFMQEFLDIQHAAKAGGKVSHAEEKEEIKEEVNPLPEDIQEMIKTRPHIDPNFVYVKDLLRKKCST